MTIIKYFLSITLLLALATGCKKEVNDDVSLVATGLAPDKLSLLFNITQDNTGRVTITPNGEGVARYDVYFGDNTTDFAPVRPGSSVVHAYGEGLYTVKVIAHSVTGKTTEMTQPLTVSFRAPENVDVLAAIDLANNFKVNVSATALYETNFNVYFGDVVNETPMTFLEGETASHVYAAPGTYTIRVVALSGGAASAEITRTVTIVDPILLPLTFESATLAYNFNNFAGGNTTIIANPQINGINTSAKVGKMIKFPGEVYGGSVLTLSAPINFTDNKIFRMKVFSPRVGAKVLLKVENSANGAQNFEVNATTTVANAWEDLVFDYRTINTANSYNNIVLIFELGIAGDGTSNFTFLFDDIRLTNSIPQTLVLPLNFESTTLDYSFTNFDGGNVTVIDNPQSAGINTSSKVGRMVKNPGQGWGGSFISLSSPIPFTATSKLKMKVFSPRAGAKVLLKVENQTDGGINFEKEVLTTVANGWEELTFDYAGINLGNSYQKVVLIFELGTVGDGSANFTFLFDDITLN